MKNFLPKSMQRQGYTMKAGILKKENPGAMNLNFVRVVYTKEGQRSSFDRRVIVTVTLASYVDDNNQEHRKSFEAKDAMPNVPRSGTVDFINSKKYQWKK